ncbi:MAG: hypothetical protein B7Z55_10545, partial [Planctomycetales bacterium 12-60-4]
MWIVLGAALTTTNWLSFPEAAAQGLKAATNGPRSTVLNVELLAGADGGALHSQAWGQVFDKWGVSLIIRRGLVSDKPDLKEKTVGTLRYVTLIGRLDRAGDLEFPGRAFSRTDAAALKEWLDELQTYGVQGTPSGKPLWGLSKPQFEELYAALSALNEEEVKGATIPVAIERLKLPVKFPFRWSTKAEERYRSLGIETTVRQPLKGFTLATTLAVMLNDRGFGFRPNRLPDGSVELVGEILSDDPLDQWPVGWPIQNQTPLVVPGMFAMANIELDDLPADSVMEAAAELTKTPVLIDYATLDREQVQLSKVLLKHPFKKTTWSLALRAMLVPEKLN